MDSFQLELFSPAGSELNLEVASVTLQAAKGEITVLPGHVGYIGVLGVGLLSYKPKDNSESIGKFVITGGFASLSDGVLRVLADAIDSPQSASKIDVSAERHAANEILSKTSSFDAAWQRASDQLKRLDAISSIARS